jgi:predicted transcriptional regulator of viral defense system
MKRQTLFSIVGDEPLFTTGMLVGPGVDLRDVRKQLSRWTSDGTVLQLRRGLYAPAPPWRRAEPHPFEVSNALVPGSYVSLETALADAGLIPEAVFATTAVTTGRQGSRGTPLGLFVYQHVKESLFWGYESVDVGGGRRAFVATAEKALLDMAYLRSGADNPAFASELRLQRLDAIDGGRLVDFAARFGSPKVERFARNVLALAREESEEYETS